ncbi:MAG TPA: 50S ribosomal protein L4 [Deltaproteobacteria bacterium]|nr:50S ribosomal protein L4 [Deltaproteobacteria bacterium]
MATIDVLNIEGSKKGELPVDENIFDGTVNEALFYEVVRMQLANRRSGTASTKTRAEVSGSGRKPWRQKGTGRARAGSIRSPLWRHGGVVFGPKPRDYSYSVPKKVVKGGLKSAIQYKINEGKLRIFDSLTVDEPKTKKAAELFSRLGIKDALIVIDGDDRNLRLAVRNLKDFKYLELKALNVYDILCYDELVTTEDTFKKIEEKLRVE